MSSFTWPPSGGGGGGVSSLNGLTGAVNLIAGTGITITPSGNNLTIAATNAGTVTNVTASSPLASSGGATPNITIQTASGSQAGALSAADWTTFNSKQAALTPGSISTSTSGVTVGSGSNSTVGPNVTVDVQTASGSQPGLLSAVDWTTFNSKQAALTIGDLTDAGTDGITVTGGTGAVIGSGTSLSQHVADTTHNGYLSSTDWNTFNGKQPAGSYITALTGDVTATGPGSIMATLANIPNKVYVDLVSGNDSNTGTLVSPWKTLQHAYNSISPTVNTPYVIYLSGGNNDLDSSPITGKPNVSIVADYEIQVQAITIGASTSNDGVAFVNLTFLGPLTWVKNDIYAMGVTLVNCLSFSGPVIKQQGSGVCNIYAFNSQFLNSEFGISNGGYGIFNGCTFYGTTAFDDPGSSGFSYLELLNSYNSGAMTITGLYSPVYLTSMIQDVAFGASLTFAAGGSGICSVETDSTSLPPTYTGSPTITYLSQANNINGAVGIAHGGTGQTTANAAFNALSPMTTGGDLIYGGASGAGTRLANGSAGQVLTSNGGTAAPSWQPVTATAPNSEVFLTGGNGYGSTNIMIRRMTTVVKNVGSDITYADSATDGATFTINTSGIYALSRVDFRSAAPQSLGFSLNSTQLTTSIVSINNADRIMACQNAQNIPTAISSTLHLSASDVVRLHDDSDMDATADWSCSFRITRIA